MVESAEPAFPLGDGSLLVWRHGDQPVVARGERVLSFSVRDANGAALAVEPYMGMAAHVVIASQDASVFAHLHPSGSISMAAFQKFTGSDAAADPHAAHMMEVPSDVAIPYAFPKAGPYRMWVQVKRAGRVMTAAFDVTVN